MRMKSLRPVPEGLTKINAGLRKWSSNNMCFNGETNYTNSRRITRKGDVLMRRYGEQLRIGYADLRLTIEN